MANDIEETVNIKADLDGNPNRISEYGDMRYFRCKNSVEEIRN